MLALPPKGFEWPSPWVSIRDESFCMTNLGLLAGSVGDDPPGSSLVAELQREVCQAHPLYGRSCRVVAQSKDDPNEFVFVTDHSEYPIAFVHLTWQVETSPSFPWTVGYLSWEAFMNDWSRDSRAE